MKNSPSAEERRSPEDSPDTSLLATSPKNSAINTPESSSDEHDRAGLSLVGKNEGRSGEMAMRESMHSSRSLSSDLELGDMRGSYTVGDDEEEDARLTKREGLEESRQNVGGEGRPSIESVDMWQEAQRVGKQAFIRKILINGVLITLWYIYYT